MEPGRLSEYRVIDRSGRAKLLRSRGKDSGFPSCRLSRSFALPVFRQIPVNHQRGASPLEVEPRTAQSVFLDAIENHAPETWSQFLDSVCSEDVKLREQMERLLQAYDRDAPFMQKPAAELLGNLTVDGPPQTRPESVTIGSSIGPYTLLEKIGEGGMGTVYMASQSKPVQRNVALKIINAGMHTQEVHIRFESERQALALMNHPNIVKFLDGGVTAERHPWFVMELLHGCPLTEYCDSHRLSVRERLELLISVCDAVQHAHQKGIIHRDLKPTNVLVEIHGGSPVPTVIDFGVAKVIGLPLSDQVDLTGIHEMVGTPRYMSPEQAGAGSMVANTRSDVYSLGVMLYELLTGRTPLERASVRTAGHEEIRRLIREVNPPRPSVSVTTLADAAISTIAQQRTMESGKLDHLLRGELDWITMKAIKKDPSRRYGSPSSLAADLRRYLNDEVVLACPPSATRK